MRLPVDVEALVRDGVIDAAQAGEMKRRAREDMVALAVNTVLFAGIAAVVGGTAALVTEPAALTALGGLVAALGAGALARMPETYRLLGNAAGAIGAAIFVGGILFLVTRAADSLAPAAVLGLVIVGAAFWAWCRAPSVLRFLAGWLTVLGVGAHLAGVLSAPWAEAVPPWLLWHYAFAVVLLCGVALDVRFLTALALVPLAAALSSRTFYGFATYGVAIYECTLTILQCGTIAVACAGLAPRLVERWGRHARLLGQMCFIWVNMAFWIGSLWGDLVGQFLWGPDRADFAGPEGDMDYEAWSAARESFEATLIRVPADAFALVWAVAILGTGLWAALTGRRAVLNIALTFGAIHFYTQYFERFSASPGAFVGAGLIAIAAAWGAWRLNRWLGAGGGAGRA